MLVNGPAQTLAANNFTGTAARYASSIRNLIKREIQCTNYTKLNEPVNTARTNQRRSCPTNEREPRRNDHRRRLVTTICNVQTCSVGISAITPGFLLGKSGSIPLRSAMYVLSTLVGRLTSNQDFAGSIPVTYTWALERWRQLWLQPNSSGSIPQMPFGYLAQWQSSCFVNSR